MHVVSPTLFCALLGVAASVQASGDGCPVPVFPVYSASADCLARVERQVREWRLCVAAYRGTEESALMQRQDADVDARMDKWLVLTRAHAGGQSERQRMLNRIERERSEYLAEQRASGRVVYAAERN